jgi:NitT/TauT family transport system substrate-binding protein
MRVGAAIGAALAGRVRPVFAAETTSALTIGLLRNPVSGLIAVTDQKGWFKSAGLDLTSILFSGAGGPKVLQAMGGGSVGLGSVSVTAALLALAAKAVPLRIVSIATDPAPVFAVLSAPEIDSMTKLAGKKVATTAGTGCITFSRAPSRNSAWDSATSSS